MKVAIFGAGSAGKYLYDELIENEPNIEVVAFIDNFKDGEYKGVPILAGDIFFSEHEVERIYITAGAQKTLKLMINTCRQNGVNELFMLHDIAGKNKLPLYRDGEVISSRIRKLKFSSEKPSLHYFEVPVTDNCNLNCKGCLFASNVTKAMQHVELSQIMADADKMAELFFDIPWIRILGGEPLLHPNIEQILIHYRKRFPDTEIDLTTNGLLIPKMNESFWETIKSNRVSIHVSGYKPTYNNMETIEDTLQQHDVDYVILRRDSFLKYYTKEADKDARENYDKCIASACYELYKGRLFSCSGVIAFERFNEMFNTDYRLEEDVDWIDLSTTQKDAWEIKEAIENPSFKCKYCDVDKMESFSWDYSGREIKIEDYLV